ncbi:hypothetical protein ACN47E_002867 [Coniothyrium glycines]
MSQQHGGSQPSFDDCYSQPYHFLNQDLFNSEESWLSAHSQNSFHRVPSPATSDQVCMPDPALRSAHHISHHPTGLPHVDLGIEPDLTNTFASCTASTPFSHSNYDPISRMVNDPPWSSANPRTSNNDIGHSRIPYAMLGSQSRICPPAPSDVTDSAYFSQMDSSVFSVDPIHSNQDSSPSATHQAPNQDIRSNPSAAPYKPLLLSDQRSQISKRSTKSNKNLECAECGETMKCNSDFKKHELKHKKPFKCTEHGCRRIRGFTTVNDLNRHKKSVHRLGLEDGRFKCASVNCRNKGKVWPRLDNFKQHIERMHPDEDHDFLIQRWQTPEEMSPHTSNDTNIELMDTDYAVTGMDSMPDNVPMISISSIEEASSWSTTEHNFQDRSLYDTNITTFYEKEPSIKTRQGQLLCPITATGKPNELYETNTSEMVRSVSDFIPGRSQHPKKIRAFSNAPQTKTQQLVAPRRQSKTSRKARASSSPNAPEYIALLKLLDIAQEGHSNEEAKGILEALRNHIHEKTADEEKDQPIQKKQCPKCPLTVPRNCDLRKHLKRHNKPYGCTYPGCSQHFGAKSDWKRHENSQHFQQEVFRCAQISLNGRMCGGFEYCEMRIVRHLKDHHKMNSPDEVTEAKNRSRIGKNYQGTFWCGFCKCIVKLNKQYNDAWCERFDHIANHFEVEEKAIRDWICMETNKAKGVAAQESPESQGSEDSEEVDEVDAQGEDDDDSPFPSDFASHAGASQTLAFPQPPIPPPPPPPPPSQNPLLQMHEQQQMTPTQQLFQQLRPPKRPAPSDATTSQHRSKQPRSNDYIRECCECQNYCSRLQSSCFVCGHMPCSNCRASYVNPNES